MQSRMRYLLPLVLAALLPVSGLADAAASQKPESARWALSFGKKKTKKPKKQKKTPKSKRSHGAKKQPRAKSGH